MDRIFYDNQEYAKYSDKFLKRYDLAQEDYDILPSETKNDDSKVFFIPDIPEHDYIYKWDYTKSLTDQVAGGVSILRASSFVEGTGIIFDGITDEIRLLNTQGVAAAGRTIEIDVNYSNRKGTSNGRFLMCSANEGFVYRNATSQWEVYSSGSWHDYTVTNSDPNIFNGKTVKAIFTKNNLKVYSDSILVYDGYGWCTNESTVFTKIGSNDGTSFYDMIITGCRVYKTEEES